MDAMNLLKNLTLGIGWLSGSLAGLSAILYACGYLIARAQQHLLGIDGLFAYDNEHFLQEGAKFFVVVGELVFQAVLALVALALFVAIIAALAYVLLRRWCARLLMRCETWRERVMTGIHTAHSRLPWSWHMTGYVILLLLLFFHLLAYRQMFIAPLSISNMLYPDPSPPLTVDPTQSMLAAWLHSENGLLLKTYFTSLLYATVEAGALAVLAWRLTASLRFRRTMALPFLVILVLYTVYLPMAYAVLVRPTRYNLITLQVQPGAVLGNSGSLFLLNKTDHEFVVWDAMRKEVLWIPSANVQRAQVLRIDSIFKGGQ